MHDTLRYMGLDPVHRKFHQNDVTFGLLYAFHENFILALSHDEVVHGKRALVAKMPGEEWQKFANLRAYYGFMFAHPGKKLLFMGDELAQTTEWNHDQSLAWNLLEHAPHQGVQALVRDLNAAYRARPELHQRDFEAEGFEWVACDDSDASVIAFLRRGHKRERFLLVVCNFTPVVRRDYRVGVPLPGSYREALNTDSEHYGGGNVGNLGVLSSEPRPAHGHPQSLAMTLPPLATLYFEPLDVESGRG